MQQTPINISIHKRSNKLKPDLTTNSDRSDTDTDTTNKGIHQLH